MTTATAKAIGKLISVAIWMGFSALLSFATLEATAAWLSIMAMAVAYSIHNSLLDIKERLTPDTATAALRKEFDKVLGPFFGDPPGKERR